MRITPTANAEFVQAGSRYLRSRVPALSVSGCSVLFVSVRQLIPEDLADIAPGPELARVLADLELSRLSGFDCVEVLKAQYRQANHERARVMAAMAQVGVCGPVPDDDLTRRVLPDEFSADEVRAALVLTRRAADAQFWLAYDLVTRLPQVHAAMDAGVLDEPRARVFSDWTTELSLEQARAVCAKLLPRAPRLTTGQLIEQIKKWAIAVDPDWARRRYEQAIADRKVVGYRNADGSANLSGYNLPLDRVAAASGHIDALAKAAKRAGDTRILDHIRADLFLGMTDGTYTGLDNAAIIELLTTTSTADADQPDSDDGGDEGDNDDGESDGSGFDSEIGRVGVGAASSHPRLEAVVVAAGVAEVGCQGGAVAGVVDGVVFVGGVGGSPAADHDAVPVADFQVAAQRGTGGAPVGLVAVLVLAGSVVVELAAQVGDQAGPVGGCGGVGGQGAQRGGGYLQFHDGPAGCEAGGGGGGSGAGGPAVGQLPVFVGDREAPLGATEGGGQVAGQLGVQGPPPS
jgi:CheY-like chemotaxis protein